MKYDKNGNLDVRKQMYILTIISIAADVLKVLLLAGLLYMLYPLIPIFD